MQLGAPIAARFTVRRDKQTVTSRSGTEATGDSDMISVANGHKQHQSRLNGFDFFTHWWGIAPTTSSCSEFYSYASRDRLQIVRWWWRPETIVFVNKNAPNGNCFLFSPCSSCVYRQDSGDGQKSGLVEGYDNSFVDVELWLTAALVGKWQAPKNTL